MDRYIIRERRAEAEYPQGNQMIAFSPTSTGGNNITMYNHQYPSAQCMSGNYVHPQMTAPISTFGNQSNVGVVSGIDPRYLAAYNDNNATFIAGISGKQMQMEANSIPMNTFGSDYQNRSFVGAQKFENKAYLHKPSGNLKYPDVPRYKPPMNQGSNEIITENNRHSFQNKSNSDVLKKQSSVNAIKDDNKVQVKTRSEKLKELNKSGPRAFSGPVEKILKWHKSLQDIGVLVLYEIVAKCVNIRAGESCAKNLLVRDENGPAMQVVYYEIDFLLPELKPPCTVRIVGRMVAGTNRFQAFNVRLASGDDVATLPRRAAVAAHHVAKLCKDFGNNTENK
ncbi:uncharacterized protein LOC123696221 [Colias croceus]|uniref:uncharacterized protein LOC123696221 n=1 Tax=Colias crocea TaxID=72248 RepID=UPI001E27D41B|nr:uncharacterized protein LOC123696221 [Colias croceus]